MHSPRPSGGSGTEASNSDNASLPGSRSTPKTVPSTVSRTVYTEDSAYREPSWSEDSVGTKMSGALAESTPEASLGRGLLIEFDDHPPLAMAQGSVGAAANAVTGSGNDNQGAPPVDADPSLLDNESLQVPSKQAVGTAQAPLSLRPLQKLARVRRVSCKIFVTHDA